MCSLGSVGACVMFRVTLQQFVVCLFVYIYQSFCLLFFSLCMGLLMYTKVASDNPVRFYKLIDYTSTALSFSTLDLIKQS